MYLRPLEPEDLELLYTIENDPSLWDTSNTDAPYSRFALKNYIASSASIHECSQLRQIIDLSNSSNEPSQPVGMIDLTNYSALNARAEVGITLLKAHRGKGLGSQALQLLEMFAVQRLRIHTLYASISPNNKASLNLFIGNGYKQVATLPRMAIFTRQIPRYGTIHEVFLKKTRRKFGTSQKCCTFALAIENESNQSRMVC